MSWRKHSPMQRHPVIADAIIDRLDGLSIQIKITGESYRKVKAKKLDSRKEEK